MSLIFLIATYLPLHYPRNTYEECPPPTFSNIFKFLKSMKYWSAFFRTYSSINPFKSTKLPLLDISLSDFIYFWEIWGEFTFGISVLFRIYCGDNTFDDPIGSLLLIYYSSSSKKFINYKFLTWFSLGFWDVCT